MSGHDGMKDHNQVTEQRQILLPHDPAPRAPFLLLSVFAHLAGLALMSVSWRTEKARILPEKFKTAQQISVAASPPFHSTGSIPMRYHASPSHVHQSMGQARVPSDVASLQTLREQAKQATAGLMTNLRSRSIYGFSPSDYQLAVKTAGEIPTISAADLPPRFQQYVIVEVTIDVDGRVADARITAGLVSPNIERTLLSAIREFRYSPAKHDGSPIPSQLDIVIHVPS
jgi:TonB family protein